MSLVRAEKVAEEADVSVELVYRMARRGELPYYKISANRIRFDLAEVLATLRQEKKQ